MAGWMGFEPTITCVTGKGLRPANRPPQISNFKQVMPEVSVIVLNQEVKSTKSFRCLMAFFFRVYGGIRLGLGARSCFRFSGYAAPIVLNPKITKQFSGVLRSLPAIRVNPTPFCALARLPPPAYRYVRAGVPRVVGLFMSEGTRNARVLRRKDGCR